MRPRKITRNRRRTIGMINLESYEEQFNALTRRKSSSVGSRSCFNTPANASPMSSPPTLAQTNSTDRKPWYEYIMCFLVFKYQFDIKIITLMFSAVMN